MKKRDRVFAAIRGEEVDHVPCGFSLHFPHDRAFGDASVEAHLRFFKETDTDIIKIMNENLVPDVGEIRTAEDWKKIPSYSMKDGFMQKQMELTEKILAKADPNAFSLGTLHGICASAIHPIEARYGYEGTRERMCAHLRENKVPVLDAFKRITCSTFCVSGPTTNTEAACPIMYGCCGTRRPTPDRCRGWKKSWPSFVHERSA